MKLLALLVIPGVIALGEWLLVPRQLGYPISGAVVGYYVALLILVIVYFLRPFLSFKKKCPDCDAPLPKVLPLPPNMNLQKLRMRH
jgi:hypothetical protein